VAGTENGASTPAIVRWRALDVLTGMAALVFIGGYLFVALSRMRYAFEVEWMEGCSVEHVRRVLGAGALYDAPSLDFVPYIYPPLYFYASALLAKISDLGLFPLRLLSFAASIVNIFLILRIAWRESASLRGGVLAAALFSATFYLAGSWFDIARVDSLFLAFLLGGFYVWRFSSSQIGALAAALFFVLAFFTKQTTAMIVLPLLVHAVVFRGRRGLLLAGTTGVGIIAGVLALDSVYGGWFSYYVFTLPGNHAWTWDMLLGFWQGDLFGPLVPACLAAMHFFFGLLRGREADEIFFWLAGAVGFIGAAWLSRLHVGGYVNVNMPAYAMVAVMAGMAWARLPDEWLKASASKRWITPVLALLLLIQSLLLFQDPRRQIPTPADRAAGMAFLAELGRLDGEVFVPGQSFIPTLAGKRSHAHAMAIFDVIRGDDGEVGRRFAEEIHDALDSKRFRWIVMHDPRAEVGWLPPIFNERYLKRPQPVFRTPGVFLPVTGIQRRPDFVFPAR